MKITQLFFTAIFAFALAGCSGSNSNFAPAGELQHFQYTLQAKWGKLLDEFAKHSADERWRTVLQEVDLAKNRANALEILETSWQSHAGEAKLSEIFSSEKFRADASNEEILKVLGDEMTSAWESIQNTLTQRIENFGSSIVFTASTQGEVDVQVDTDLSVEELENILTAIGKIGIHTTYKGEEVSEALFSIDFPISHKY